MIPCTRFTGARSTVSQNDFSQPSNIFRFPLALIEHGDLTGDSDCHSRRIAIKERTRINQSVRTYTVSAPPFLRHIVRYVRTHRITGKHRHIVSHQHLDTQKATHSPSGGIGHIVAVFQVVPALAGDQGFAEAAGLQGGQIIFGAINLVCLVQLFGAGR